ncbi:MAG: VOC family protein [Acidimicrobiales bacterium]
MPALKRIGITVDCPDAELSAAFWESCLGYTRRSGAPGGPYVTLERGDGSPDGPPVLTFQTVPEPKTSKARVHLDLFVEAAVPLVEEMRAAGASLLSRTEAGDWTTRVLQDPAGNEFCVIGPD